MRAVPVLEGKSQKPFISQPATPCLKKSEMIETGQGDW
jgi:hypothetical protein